MGTERLIPPPNHYWKCEKCGKEGVLIEEVQTITCPNLECGNKKVEVKLISKGGPEGKTIKKHKEYLH